MSAYKTKVVIADDHQEVRAEIQELLSEQFQVCGVVANGKDLVDVACLLHPDVVVTDLQMPHLDGIGAVRRILELGCCRAAIALSTHTEQQVVESALTAGFLGFVAKIDAGQELTAAVVSVVSGARYLSREVLTKLG